MKYTIRYSGVGLHCTASIEFSAVSRQRLRSENRCEALRLPVPRIVVLQSKSLVEFVIISVI